MESSQKVGKFPRSSWKKEDEIMITYLDTSSLVKLYVDEPASREVKNLVSLSNQVASSIVAYAESRAAFARRYREKAFTTGQHKKLIKSLDEDWDHYLIIMLTKEIALTAGNLAEKHGLRGFDAIHLSSALSLGKELSSRIIFSCADQKLQTASEKEGLYQPDYVIR